jgi:sugar phosphate permease
MPALIVGQGVDHCNPLFLPIALARMLDGGMETPGDAAVDGRWSAGATARAAPGRWLMWSIPTALFLIAFFHRAAPGVIARDLMEAFEVTGATIGLLAAAYFYSYAGLMIPAGVLIDGLGARAMIALGGAVMGAGAIAMAVAPGAPLLFTGRLVVGLGASVTFIGALKIAAAWFPPTQFGFLAALTATAGVLGALASSLPLAALVTATGWRGAFWIVGLLTLGLAVLCAVVVRDRPRGVAAASPPGLGAAVRGMGAVLRNPHTWPPFLAFFCLYAATGNLLLWIIPYLRDVHGLGATQAALYATAPSLALLASAPLTGFVSDRVLRRRKAPYTALNGGLFALWVVFVATLQALPLAGVFALLFAMGICGAAFVLTWPIAREVNPPALDGIAVAVVNLGGFLGAALTQGPLGVVLDARWAGALDGGARVYPVEAYRAVFTVCAGFVGAAGLLSLLFRETYGRNIYPALRDAPARGTR